MLYIPKLYLSQMAPLDMQRVTPCTKGFGPQFWCRTILTSAVGVTLPIVPSVVSKILGSITFFLRLDEAILFAWRKLA